MKRVLWLIPLAGLVLFLTPVLAQTPDQIITLGTQQWMQDVFTDELIAEFEAQNPGVKVIKEILSQDPDTDFWGFNTLDVADSYKRASAYAAMADVIPLSSYQLSPEISRAGYFLDLTPLMSTDPDFNPDDFFPAALESYQLDNSTWGLPVSIDINAVIYNQTAFDAAGADGARCQWQGHAARFLWF
jgi:ABC-type glycerol-3-phosphate transport system substrate-binding protein